jgi:hypothetical protein
MKRLLLPLVPLVLAACASTPPAGPQAATGATDKGTVCERDIPTGSMLSKSTCRTAEQREAERAGVAATAEAIRNQRNMPPGK